MTIDPKEYTTGRPGKFEGEPPETAYFYDQWLNGVGDSIYPMATDDDDDDADDHGIEYTIFEVNAEESEAFALDIGSYVVLWEDRQGFVMLHTNLGSHAAAIAWIGQHAGIPY